MSDLAALKLATSAAAQEEYRKDSGRTVRVAGAELVARRLGWSVRKVVALWRRRGAALGGRYSPAFYRRANPRAFNAYARQASWKEAEFVFE